MKFAQKLFLSITALLAVSFTLFGTWMLTSYFDKVQSREIAQADTQSRMYQSLFEIAYRSAEDVGEEYAITHAVQNILTDIETEGTRCFLIGEESWYYGESAFSETETAQITALTEHIGVNEESTAYIYGTRRDGDQYTLYYISTSQPGSEQLYLGIARDLTDIYEDRQLLLNQYRVSLALVLLIGGTLVYVLTWYLTRPITDLSYTARRIADGSYEVRSHIHSEDEIGILAESFNSMADRLVEEMQTKEREAQQKADFTAAFAHELKTPLTSIIGYADMLNTMELDESERHEAYYYIYSQGKRLESLSHKLLELVSMDRQPMEENPVLTKQLEETLRTAMRPIWDRKGVNGKVVMQKAVLRGDADLLLSLFYNLLDNAVKATEPGGFVLLKGEVCEAEEEGRLVPRYVVKVMDTGRGIPENEIGRITEAFYMVDKSRSRREGGAGIGLSLCARIAALHHVALNIRSKPGIGTVMTVVFPLEYTKKHAGKNETD